MTDTRNRKLDRAVGYIRASTTEQALGPEAQRVAIQEWCNQHGVELVAIEKDIGVSGGAPLDRRPGLLAAVQALADDEANLLVVAKRDRLARDVLLGAMIEKMVERRGGHIRSADGAANGDGPEAQLMGHILGAFAAYERELIKARTKAALGRKRARGERTGQVPYGYQVASCGVRLEPHPDEQVTIQLIEALRRAGLSIRRIAERLNRDGVPPRGRRWYPTTVARVLRRRERTADVEHLQGHRRSP